MPPGGMPALPSPLPPGVMGPQPVPGNVRPFPQERARKPKERKQEQRQVPDFALVPIEEIAKRSPYGKRKPTYEEIVADCETGRTRYRARNDSAFEQEQCYYRMRKVGKYDGRDLNPAIGEVVFRLSRATKAVDRLVALVRPRPDRVVFELAPRSDREEHKEAAQRVENWVRHQFVLSSEDWWDKVSQGEMQPDLWRKVLHLAALHGSCGWAMRVDTTYGKHNTGEHPFPWVPVPLTELYPLGHATVREQVLTLDEARAEYLEIAERWPKPREGDERRDPYPDDDTPVRIIWWSDRNGLYHAGIWDMDGPYSWREQRRARPADEDDKGRWVQEPHRIDYGFCAYQLPPGFQATGAPPLPHTPGQQRPGERFPLGATSGARGAGR